MLRNFYAFLIFTVCLALPPVALVLMGNTKYVLPQFWGIFILLSALTLGVIIAVELVQKRYPAMYAQTFLIMTIVKMITTMLLALLIVLKTDVNDGIFMLDFFYIYFLNTGFEVYILLRNLRNQN